MKNSQDSYCLQLWHNETLLGGIEDVDRSDPSTWTDNWPVGGGVGFIESKNEYLTKQVWHNRQNPKVIKIFHNILGTLTQPGTTKDQHLHIKLDRYCMMRPTKDVKLKDGSIVDKPEWKTQSSWLHLDQNPWAERGWHRLQGFLALTDHTDSSGGFDCVPKFHNRIDEWANNNPIEGTGYSMLHELIRIPKTDPMWNEICHILMPVGSLLIWDSRIPHQNWPNNDSTWRIVQYVTFRYVSEEMARHSQKLQQKKILNGLIPWTFVELTTDLGKDVFGLTLRGKDPPHLEALSDAQITAVGLLDQAKETEASGDARGAANLYRRAFKLNPELEEIINEPENLSV